VTERNSVTLEPAHILMGLLRENTGLSGQILRSTYGRLVDEVVARLPRGLETIPEHVEVPFSPSTVRTLEFAQQEADRLHHNHIGDEHLLLALLREDASDVASVLLAHGVDRQVTENAIVRVAHSLRDGLYLRDKAGKNIFYRYLRVTDDVEAITDMLHEAYGAHAAKGMRFVASHQDSATTRRRMARGETIVAEDADAIVGIITLKHSDQTHGSPFYEQPEVAGFGQFAVRPSHQGQGIGAALLNFVEQRAAEQGVVALAFDTSERATDLVEWYESKGYRFVEHLQWPETNYRSVLLAKRLQPE
jgi:GNAT superfamily N-acetyltransferase